MYKNSLSDIKISKGDYDEKQVGDRFTEIKLYQGVFENYQKITPNKKAIIFASNIESSKTLVADFLENGLPIKHIDGETPQAERRQILKWFKNSGYEIKYNRYAISGAAEEGYVQILKWFKNRNVKKVIKWSNHKKINVLRFKAKKRYFKGYKKN